MDERRIQKVEISILGLAAASLATSVGFALRMADVEPPIVAASALAVFGLVLAGLRALPDGSKSFAIPAFTVPELAAHSHESELDLAEADIVGVTELLLDRPIGQARESRVVALFGGSAFPTAGEMQATIDRHLERRRRAGPDAAQALSDALDELRRSLR